MFLDGFFAIRARLPVLPHYCRWPGRMPGPPGCTKQNIAPSPFRPAAHRASRNEIPHCARGYGEYFKRRAVEPSGCRSAYLADRFERCLMDKVEKHRAGEPQHQPPHPGRDFPPPPIEDPPEDPGQPPVRDPPLRPEGDPAKIA
jgi:hypothetical protein